MPVFRVTEGVLEKHGSSAIANAGRNFASHLWRNTAAGNMGGWQAARCLVFLHVLTGSVGKPGGLNPNSWDKAHPHPTDMPRRGTAERNDLAQGVAARAL